MREQKIKTLLIDLLLSEDKENIKSMAHEVRFADGKRRADLISIDEYVHAYEIKSEFDNLTSLWKQVADYQKSFQSLTLVIADKYKKEVLQGVPKSIGIIVIEETKLVRVRKARIRVKFKKTDILSLLSLAFVKKELKRLGVPNSKLSVVNARQVLSNHVTLNYCLEAVKISLMDATISGFREFLQERGDATTPDDLRLFKFTDRELFFED